MMKLNNTTKCLFCNKPKTWKSEIWIVSENKEFKVTVCETCRKDPKIKLFDLYTAIPKKLTEEKK